MRRRFALIIRAIANGSKRLGQSVVAPFSTATIAALAGTAATTMGLYLVYPPLALIVPGVCVTAFGLWLAGLDFRPPPRGDE